jgi:PAS domain S-box-containing protein
MNPENDTIGALASPGHVLAPLFANSDLGIAILDQSHRFQSINNSLAAMNGLPIDAHLGKSLRHIIGPVAGELEPRFKRTFASGETIFFELTAKLPARPNTAKWTETFIPIRDASKRVIRVCAIVMEVTEKRRLEESLFALTGKLLYLNTILTRHLEDLSIKSHHRREDGSPLMQSVKLVEQCTAEIIEVLNLVQPLPKSTSKMLLRQANSFSLSALPKIPLSPDDEQLLQRVSQREREVLQLLASNKCNKEVALALGISVRTVEVHRRRIMEKLGLHSISELIHLAIRNGIVDA